MPPPQVASESQSSVVPKLGSETVFPLSWVRIDGSLNGTARQQASEVNCSYTACKADSCVRAYTCIYIHIHIYIYVYMHVYTCIHICMYIYIYVHIYIHVYGHMYYVYVHTHVYVEYEHVYLYEYVLVNILYHVSVESSLCHFGIC